MSFTRGLPSKPHDAKLENDRYIEVQLTLRNLFDKPYFVSRHLHASRWITPGKGRNAQLSATYRF